MRIWISLTIALVSLTLAPSSRAVPLDPGGRVGVVAQQRAPGSLQWDVYLFSAPGAEVGTIILVTDGFDDFVFAPAIPNVSYPDSFWAPSPYGDGRGMVFVTNWVGNIGGTFVSLPLGGSDDLDGVLLGTLTSVFPTLDSVALLVDLEWVGHPAYTTRGEPFPLEDVVMRIVPEAGSALALFAIAALTALRSRPAQHRSR